MKERIYTIPINDAFDEVSECPLCRFAKKEEADRVEYTLGDSMMQPDERIKSNEKGYCPRHTKLLLSSANKLSYALILETRLAHLAEQTDKMAKSLRKPKKISIGKSKNDDISKAAESFSYVINSCVICERLESVTEMFVDNLFYLYKTETEFRKKFFNSQGFCVHHFELLLKKCAVCLGEGEAHDFAEKLIALESENLKRVQDDISWFTKKFDYRYKDEDWKNSRDAVERASEKISTY